MEYISSAISINRWISHVFAIVCIAILVAVFATSVSIPDEHRIILATVLGCIVVALQLVLLVSRHNPPLMLIFSTLSSFFSGICIGGSFRYV